MDWLAEIDRASERERKWRNKARDIEKLYRDEEERSDSKYNILWANTETLKPVLLGNAPLPDVRRRFRQQDNVGRDVALALERALSFSNEADDTHDELDAAVLDYLLSGRGGARVDYVPTIENEEVISEEVTTTHFSWDDLRLGPARKWKEMPWIAFRHLMSESDLEDQFPGKEVKLTVTIGSSSDASSLSGKDKPNRAEIWEVWDKEKRERLFVSKGYDGILQRDDDPLNLKGFFPMPKPLYSLKTSRSMIPVPEYTLYADQAGELNDVTARIDKLIDALKARGVYDASLKEAIANLLSGEENTLFPIQDWRAIIEGGGIAGAVDWVPIEQFSAVLGQLYIQRSQLLDIIYQITGISDIMRGAGDPRDTAAAQKLKGKFGSLRINPRQNEVARFARDIFRIKAEITAMSGVRLTDEMVSLLRDEKLRGFRIDVETDSTVAPDEEEQKQAVIEYLGAVGNFLSVMAPAAEAGLVPGDAVGGLLLWASRKFKVSREVEDLIANAQANPQLSSEQKAVQAGEMQKIQLKMAEIQGNQQLEVARLQQRQKEAEDRDKQKTRELDIQEAKVVSDALQ